MYVDFVALFALQGSIFVAAPLLSSPLLLLRPVEGGAMFERRQKTELASSRPLCAHVLRQTREITRL